MSNDDAHEHRRHPPSPTRTPRLALAGAAALLVLLAWCAPAASAAKSEPADDSARLVGIGGGRKLFLECRGHGSPTVVLVTGLGERAENWSETTTPGDADNAVLP